MAARWLHTIHSHSFISGQISLLSTPLVGRFARRILARASRPHGWTSCLCLCCRIEAVNLSGRRKCSTLAVGAVSNDHIRHPLPCIRLVGGILKAHMSKGRVMASGGGGVESGSKDLDREILVQHILFKEDQMELLMEVQRKVFQEGLDLSDLAEENSICPSKAEGGMLGWLKLGQTDPAFEEVAFNAPLNKLVRGKTQRGLHLLQVLSERRSHFLQQIQVENFHEKIQEPGFFEQAQLIDVREPDEISIVSIKGFEAYPLSQFGQWAPNIADDLDPEKDTYVLCHHGVRSMQAASWLQSQGFKRLYNIAGGIHAYATKVDETLRTY